MLFGKEADKLEHANDDERTYYIIEKDPLVNTFISVPKDKGLCLFCVAKLLYKHFVCRSVRPSVTRRGKCYFLGFYLRQEVETMRIQYIIYMVRLSFIERYNRK